MVSLGWLSPSLSPLGCIVLSLIIQKSSRFSKIYLTFSLSKVSVFFKFLDNCKFRVSVEVMIRTVEVPIGANCINSTDILAMVVEPKAMFTLYRIGFCSVSKVAPVQCEQELMFCCGAEIVPNRSQCEQKPYPLCNLQRSLLI